MYRDGYLVRCGGPTFDSPSLYFCVFGDGKLSLYSDIGGKLIGELSLAGRITKVRVEKAVPGKLPHRFSISTADVLRIEGRRMKLGETRVFEFAAATNDLMKEWANTVHLWRRMNWKENVKFFDSSRDLEQRDQRAELLLQIKLLNEAKLRRTMGASTVLKLRTSMLGRMAVQTPSSVAKLKDRVMQCATRTTSSCATTTTASVA